MVKGKGKKKKKGKKVGPAPPPYYPVTLPEPYRFGQIIGTVVTGKNQLEEKAQKALHNPQKVYKGSLKKYSG